MDKNQSEVWNHFKKLTQKESAQCIHCPKQISCKGSNTSGLGRHLERIHKINIDKKNSGIDRYRILEKCEENQIKSAIIIKLR